MNIVSDHVRFYLINKQACEAIILEEPEDDFECLSEFLRLFKNKTPFHKEYVEKADRKEYMSGFKLTNIGSIENMILAVDYRNSWMDHLNIISYLLDFHQDTAIMSLGFIDDWKAKSAVPRFYERFLSEQYAKVFKDILSFQGKFVLQEHEIADFTEDLRKAVHKARNANTYIEGVSLHFWDDFLSWIEHSIEGNIKKGFKDFLVIEVS